MSGFFLRFWPLLAAVLILPLMLPSLASAYERKPQKPAIVLAVFGTTEPRALSAILNVEKKIQKAFPEADVFMGFTSNRVREVWHERARNKAWRAANKNVPAELYTIANPLAVMARLQDEGSRPIIVQSLHITNGTEFDDQKAIVETLAKITAFQEAKRPFPWLSMGDSALGRGKTADLEKAAAAMKGWVDEARSQGAALVLMGHGNDHVDVKSYRELTSVMVKKYGPMVFMALVEGKPSPDDMLEALKKSGVKKVLLAPFMLVAGEHARNDMAGDEEDSLASRLKAEGITVKAKLQGLGSVEAWAQIYVDRIKDQWPAYQKYLQSGQSAKKH